MDELGTLLPYDQPSKLFQTLIAWGRYAELVDFDQNANVVYLHEASESDDEDAGVGMPERADRGATVPNAKDGRNESRRRAVGP